MAEFIIRLTREQAAAVYECVQKHCANCVDGNCLLLDDGDFIPCPQLITRSLLCRYFINAVLPGDRQLYGSIMGWGTKQCVRCGESFYPRNVCAKYCDRCRPIVRREMDRNRKQAKKRGTFRISGS